MKRSHRIVFTLIALLAVATFLFGLLQFLNPGQRPDRTASGTQTNGPVSPPAR